MEVKAIGMPGQLGRPIPVAKGSDLTAPFPDPGEPFQDVYAHIYGQKTTVAAPVEGQSDRWVWHCQYPAGRRANESLRGARSAEPSRELLQGACEATTPMLAMLSPFLSEGTALMWRTTPMTGARGARIVLPK